MLENPPPSAADPPSAVARLYAPPNQRNRSLGRRKSGGYEDMNASRNVPTNDRRGSGIGNFPNESSQSGLIPLEGCCSSEAYQLLSDRWTVAIHSCNDPSLDLSDRPVMYSESSASAWGRIKLPHQLLSPGGMGSPGSQMDFMSELHHQVSCRAK